MLLEELHSILQKSTKSILLIDDDASFREAFRFRARKWGYQLQMAEGALEGIQALKHHRPLVVLCDLVMGEHDGFEVLNAFQNSLPDDPYSLFCFLTSLEQRDQEERAYRQGVVWFVKKPNLDWDLFKDQLDAHSQSVLAIRMLQRQNRQLDRAIRLAEQQNRDCANCKDHLGKGLNQILDLLHQIQGGLGEE